MEPFPGRLLSFPSSISLQYLINQLLVATDSKHRLVAASAETSSKPATRRSAIWHGGVAGPEPTRFELTLADCFKSAARPSAASSLKAKCEQTLLENPETFWARIVEPTPPL
jgi:hypothetical protein